MPYCTKLSVPEMTAQKKKLRFSTTDRGRAAEDQALAFLLQQGLSIVQRNFRCRRGEIDLIMREGAVLVFVEVRQRSSQLFGGAAASVGLRKQARLWHTAAVYLQRLKPTPACRFDAVCIEGENIQWLRHILSA